MSLRNPEKQLRSGEPPGLRDSCPATRQGSIQSCAAVVNEVGRWQTVRQVLAAAYEDGSCILWEWESATQLVALQRPPELRRGSFNRVRFLHDGSPTFFTVVNAAGQVTPCDCPQ